MKNTIYFNNINSFYSENIGLEICSQEKLGENEQNLIKNANFDSDTLFESWCAIGTNNQLAYSTHGMFRYFGKFPPVIATYLINNYTCESDLIIDPMSGSGTSAVECLLLNRNCIVNDVNPMSSLLAKVKSTYIPEKDLLDTLAYINNNYTPLTIDEYAFEPVALKNYQHWFLEETSNSLRGLKKLIDKIEDININNFFKVVFASIVRRVSKATTQQGRLFLDVETALPDALELFNKKAHKAILAVSSLPINNKITVLNNDMRSECFDNYIGKAKLVILHPPYFNSYKYSSINSLETGWLGFDRVEYRKQEIKEFFKVGKPEKVSQYVDDMHEALTNALSLLNDDGVLALMIGDAIIKGNYLPVTQMLIDKIDKNNYLVEKIAIRIPKYTEATWVASQRRKSNDIGITLNDFIVIFRKVKKNEK